VSVIIELEIGRDDWIVLMDISSTSATRSPMGVLLMVSVNFCIFHVGRGLIRGDVSVSTFASGVPTTIVVSPNVDESSGISGSRDDILTLQKPDDVA
jgi:hypothetical protein